MLGLGWLNAIREQFTRSFGERDADVLLTEVNKILNKTRATLDEHQSVLPKDEYESFKAQHRRFDVQVQLEEKLQRNFNAALIRHGRVPSQTSETREEVRARALDLLTVVENFQDRVIEASSRASLATRRAFPDEAEDVEMSDTSSTTSTVPTRSSTPNPSTQSKSSRSVGPSSIQFGVEWASKILEGLADPDIPLEFKAALRRIIEDPNCMTSVAHLLQPHVKASKPSLRAYARYILFRHHDQIIAIPDDRLYELESEEIVLTPMEHLALQDLVRDWYYEILRRDID